MNDRSLPPPDPTATAVFGGLPAVSWRRIGESALIRARGPEARGFLQSQLSNDADRVSEDLAQLSGYCSPKGRLLAVFGLIQLESPDSFGLELPAELLPATLKRLRMFVLRSRLTLDDASGDWPALALAGPASAEMLGSLGLPAPAEAWGCARTDGVLVLRRPGAWPRYQLHAAPERLAALETSLAARPALDEANWRLAELSAGTPVVRAGTVDRFVPQTANLDLAGGISFTKGCYPGQEIVARVHYLGRLKQRLHLADCDAPGQPGEPVLPASAGAQGLGEVMDSAPLPGGGYRLALVLQLERESGIELRLGAGDGPPLRDLRPLTD